MGLLCKRAQGELQRCAQETRRADSGIPCIGSCEDLLILAQVVHDAVHLLWREDSFTIFHDLKPDSPPP